MKHFSLLYRHGGIVVALILLFRLITLPLFPLMEPSEARYAALAVQMAASGDFVVPWIWIDGSLIPFLGKPPLFFWCDALSIMWFGINEFAARLPCLLFAAFTVLTVIWTMRRPLGTQTALMAGVVTGSCGLFVFLAGSVAVDMALSFGVTVAFCGYFRWLKATRYWEGFGWSLLVFIGLAVAFLTKGLAGIALFGLPITIYHVIFGGWKRVLTHHAWWAGLPLFALIVLPWFFAINNATTQMSPPFDFFHYFFVEEHYHRFTSLTYEDLYGSGRIQPRGMAILFFLAAALPWTLVPFYWLWKKREWRPFNISRRENNLFWVSREEAFCFLAFVIPTLFLCGARQLLITYLQPVLPMFAVWLAMVWMRKHGTECLPRLYAVVLGIWSVIFVGVVVLSFYYTDIFSKMGTEKLVQETLREVPDVKFVVATRGRFYSPYFYAYHHLYDGPHPDSCLIRSNQGTFVPMPCVRMMPTRRPQPLLRNLDWLSDTYSDTRIRVIVNSDVLNNLLPKKDSGVFTQIQYFRIWESKDPAVKDYLEACSREEAEYERTYSYGRFSVLRPLEHSHRIRPPGDRP